MLFYLLYLVLYLHHWRFTLDFASVFGGPFDDFCHVFWGDERRRGSCRFRWGRTAGNEVWVSEDVEVEEESWASQAHSRVTPSQAQDESDQSNVWVSTNSDKQSKGTHAEKPEKDRVAGVHAFSNKVTLLSACFTTWKSLTKSLASQCHFCGCLELGWLAFLGVEKKQTGLNTWRYEEFSRL